MHTVVAEVTDRIRARSHDSRQRYLQHIEQAICQEPVRNQLGCTNLAHDYAAASEREKLILSQQSRSANIAIINAYNDVLSAHAPYRHYPQQIKDALAKLGHVAQVASGVPAMCDGITQGQAGMELSLFSRDVIALSTTIGLSHQVFDGALMLGICDKIVPGLLMAALRFGHLPVVFVPAGPMPSGLSNHEKALIRQRHAAGEASDAELLSSEMQSYHSEGTCTFYGTANSNQMLMEMMGLQLPGSSFINPDDPLRLKLTEAAAQRVTRMTALEHQFLPCGQLVDERTLVNAMVGLLASGGSTNHSIHLVAIARMAGIHINWQDLSDLSAAVPLLVRVYPNGKADINHFQRSGGMAFLIRELVQAGLLHTDVKTVMGEGLEAYMREPYLDENHALCWREAAASSGDLSVLTPAQQPFMPEGGMKLLEGNLGRAMMKVSAVPDDRWRIEAPARVFDSQDAVLEAYQQKQLNMDVVVVLKQQGPKANGMPELHKLTPALANLQDDGYRVALVTDGRLSGASGKVPAAIHVSPEAMAGGLLSRVQDGDSILIDAHTGTLAVQEEDFADRPEQTALAAVSMGLGRELFQLFRQQVGPADQGAISIQIDEAPAVDNSCTG